MTTQNIHLEGTHVCVRPDLFVNGLTSHQTHAVSRCTWLTVVLVYFYTSFLQTLDIDHNSNFSRQSSTSWCMVSSLISAHGHDIDHYSSRRSRWAVSSWLYQRWSEHMMVPVFTREASVILPMQSLLHRCTYQLLGFASSHSRISSTMER